MLLPVTAKGASLHIEIVSQISWKLLDYDRKHYGYEIYMSNRRKNV